MLYVDIPTHKDIVHLGRERAAACVSIYLETTTHTQHINAARIEFSNLTRTALQQLEAIGFDKRASAAIAEQLDDLGEDDDFWTLQAHSLAVFATPDSLRSYRVASRLASGVHVSDRFHLKPLLRTVSFHNSAWVLALAENGARVIRVQADGPAEEVRLAGMPKDAASFAGKSTLNDRTDYTRSGGPRGHKMHLRLYARKIDELLRPLLKSTDLPLVLAATEPLASLYRTVNSSDALLKAGITASPGELTPAQLAEAARPLLDGFFGEQVAAVRQLLAERANQGRAIVDVAQAARAAVSGAIDTLLVDIDKVIPGFMDDQTGALKLAQSDDARAYDVIDEIAVTALLAGARVLAVRATDMPDGAAVAAVTRYPV